MKTCIYCQQAIDQDARFCPYCGKSAPSSAQQVIRIGRATDNELVFSDLSVSSHHCLIRQSEHQIMIEDLNSTNGTYVNGSRIQSVLVIHENDRILLGNTIDIPWHLIKSYTREENIKPGHFQKELIRIGRAEDNDIILNDIKVSRYHAELKKQGSQYLIKDLGSSNGTYVNHKKVSEALVSQDDCLRIAGYELPVKSLFKPGQPAIDFKIQISVKNLSFRVSEKVLIQPMDLCINGGEFVGLIGPSGAGKTTLMLMLAGINACHSGRVMINSISLHHHEEMFQGQIGYVPQEDIIHRELTVQESLNYTCRLRLGKQLSDKDRKTHISKILKDLHLQESQNVLIGSPEKKGISGGQRKRVNMAQELVTEPSILFLDEPTSGLDPQSDSEVMDLLQGIAGKGKIVIITTHNITRRNFEKLSHLIVMAKDGYLAYFGPAQDAVSYFEVRDPEDIFKKLEDKTPEQWAEKYRESFYYQKEIQDKY
ncbi:MAG TPA: FHA domain-containing protein, partial [Candidatus Cloacimonadota bacterium]|nr:FHA domain-containing protein [Candidatus Cloacimonadota bacterium]